MTTPPGLRALRPAPGRAAPLLSAAGALFLGGCSADPGLGSYLDFHSHPLWLNLLVFAAVGAAVWLAGTRLSRYVNEISERTGAGKAFLGALLLGGITSLPEIATTVTASLTGSPTLAVNNIFGSVAINVLLLALVADVFDGGRALTAQVTQSTLILQGALSIFVIAVAAAAVMLSERALFGVGIGSMLVFAVGVAAFYLMQRFQFIQRWAPAGEEGSWGERQRTELSRSRSLVETAQERIRTALERQRESAGGMRSHGHLARAYEHRAEAHRELARAYEELVTAEALRSGGRGRPLDLESRLPGPETRDRDEGGSAAARAREQRERVKRLSTARLALYTVVAALTILVAGFFLSQTGSAIADQTGLGASLVGFVLVAFATSLPEISSLISAVRLGEFSLVFSEVFGTNVFNATLILYADLAYREGPLLEQSGHFAQFAALLGIMLTAVYVVGLVTRSEDTSFLRLGKDSLVVVALYAVGVVVLYTLR